MQKTRVWLLTATVGSLALGGVLMARMTAAQGPEDRGGGGRSPGGSGRDLPGQRSPGSSLRGPGGPGGIGGQTPIMMGVITEADAGNGTISFTSQFGGGDQSIKVNANTKYSTQTTAAVEDLKVNDRVQVQGVPTGITANSILTGDLPDVPGGGPNARAGSGTPGGSNAANVSGQGQNPPQQRVQASATATGAVTSLSPLTISIGNDITVVVKLAANARVNKVTPTSFTKLKAGDRLIATGQTGSDGTFTATTVGVNLEIAGMAPGAFGPAVASRPGKPAGPGTAGGPGADTPPTADTDPGTDTTRTVALQLLQANCGCHNGGGRGPDLSHEGSKQAAGWIAAYIANPQSKNPRSRMPAMASRLSSQDITKIANFLANAK
jgi:mono/diheme cytochrome c family protein